MLESQKGIKRAFSLKKEDWHFSSCCAFDLYFISLNIFPRIISSLFMWNDFLWREQGIQNACFVFFFFLLFCFNKDILITYKHYRMRSKAWVRGDDHHAHATLLYFLYTLILHYSSSASKRIRRLSSKFSLFWGVRGMLEASFGSHTATIIIVNIELLFPKDCFTFFYDAHPFF